MWVEDELRNVALSVNQTTLLNLQPVSRFPERAREGMIIYADGANLNPGAGEGPYVYDGTVWKNMISAGFQPLDADLTAIAGLTGVNVIYYRSANVPPTWSPVVIGNSLTFTSGTLGVSPNVVADFARFDGGSSPLSGLGTVMSVSCAGAGTQWGISIRMMLDGGNYMLFTNSTDVTIGSISNLSGGSVAYNTTCDAELKTEVENLPPVGDIIDRLRPVRFKWKHRLESGYWSGFVAQEAHSVVPQAVTPRDGIIPWMMDYSKLVPLLVAEVKSLRERIAALEAARG
jgi:hypothetical protein